MTHFFNQFKQKPTLYEKSNTKFWDDPYISKQMLKVHLNPDVDSATRSHAFVKRSVQWITQTLPPTQWFRLMDLGCGPGIYTELFAEKGYQVTGLDISENSIQYATSSATQKHLDIDYLCADYSSWVAEGTYDLVTMIYCDFGVLSPETRESLLQKIYNMLAPQGRFLFDVFSPDEYQGREEYKNWNFEKDGFWQKDSCLVLSSLERYDESNTFLNRYIIVSDNDIKDYLIWEHTFTLEELKQDLARAGFKNIQFYSDVAGTEYNPSSKTICVIAEKL